MNRDLKDLLNKELNYKNIIDLSIKIDEFYDKSSNIFVEVPNKKSTVLVDSNIKKYVPSAFK